MMHRCFRKADLNMGLVAIVSERALLSTGNLSVSFAQCGINPQRIAELTLRFFMDNQYVSHGSNVVPREQAGHGGYRTIQQASNSYNPAQIFHTLCYGDQFKMLVASLHTHPIILCMSI